jgi:hypothetical protein
VTYTVREMERVKEHPQKRGELAKVEKEVKKRDKRSSIMYQAERGL